MKIFIDGQMLELNKVKIVFPDIPEDGLETHWTLSQGGLLVDIVKDGKVTDTGWSSVEDLSPSSYGYPEE